MADFEENKITIDNPENQGDDECYASLEEYFIDCCRHGELDEVKQAILDGVDVNYFDNNLNTPLHMACANGHIDIIKELLQVKKDDKRVVNVNARNADGSTPLHWAVINDQKVALELLIENGADCNIKSKYEHTPLDEAILGGRYEIAEILASKTKPGEEELIVVEEEDDKVENGVGGDDDEGEEEADDS